MKTYLKIVLFSILTTLLSSCAGLGFKGELKTPYGPIVIDVQK